MTQDLTFWNILIRSIDTIIRYGLIFAENNFKVLITQTIWTGFCVNTNRSESICLPMYPIDRWVK